MEDAFEAALREQEEGRGGKTVEQAVEAAMTLDMMGEEGHRLGPGARAEMVRWMASKGGRTKEAQVRTTRKENGPSEPGEVRNNPL